MKSIVRKKEISILEDFIFKSNFPVFYLYGDRGIGKTTLIHQFINKNNKKLLNKYELLSGSSLEISVLDFLLTEKDIIIIDDYDLSSNDINLLIKKSVDINPKRKILISSRQKPFLTNSNVFGRIKHLELKGLPFEEIFELIKDFNSNKIFNYQPLINQELFEALNNNPKSILELIQFLTKYNNNNARDIISKIDEPINQSGIVDIDGNPIGEHSAKIKQIENKVIIINNSLVEKVHTNPELIYNISPTQFEELVAELLTKEGFNVNLTKKTRDGGKDIFIAHSNSLGNFLYYVECKQYSPDNHIGVRMVRELYGTVCADRATAGLLISTSYFSPDAKKFVEKISNQISLKDYLELKEWINQVYLKTKNSA